MVAFTAGAVLTAANLNSAFNALTIRTVTGTSDTLVLADNGGCVTYSNASPVAVTVPLFSSIAYATGTKIVLVNLGAGVVTVAGAVGVTVNGSPLTLAQNAGATLIKTATNTWSFLPFSSGVGAADFSDTATGSYTGYKYKTFTASGTITITTAGFADIVVVGGGGGAGLAGGGAGGSLVVTNAYLPVGTLTVTVGAGGAGNSNAGHGINGSASQLSVYGALGGGGGGGSIGAAGDNVATGQPGGSGGGGGFLSSGTAPGGPGQIGQGSAGGSAATASSGGGGGGTAAVGADATANTGGAGGAGTTTSIAGTTPTGAYVAGSYAYGGGGGGGGFSTGGAGGSGGGGTGASGASGNTAGAVNKGGGGGGRYNTLGAPAGGSGLVIVKVAV